MIRIIEIEMFTGASVVGLLKLYCPLGDSAAGMVQRSVPDGIVGRYVRAYKEIKQ